MNSYTFKVKYNDLLDWLVFTFQNPYKIIPQGHCPVQAWGNLPSNEYYYFRARGNRWYVKIAPNEKDWEDRKILFSYSEEYSEKEFEAGWMTKREAIKFATKAINKYLKK